MADPDLGSNFVSRLSPEELASMMAASGGMPGYDPVAAATSAKLPQAPVRKPVVVEPSLTDVQLGYMHLPEGYSYNDADQVVDEKGIPVNLTHRPTVLPWTKTPEGDTINVMPQVGDILASMGGGGRVPIKAGETVLGAGITKGVVKTAAAAPEAKAATAGEQLAALKPGDPVADVPAPGRLPAAPGPEQRTAPFPEAPEGYPYTKAEPAAPVPAAPAAADKGGQAPYLYHISTADNLAGIGSAGLDKGTFFATEAPSHIGNVEMQQQFPTFRTIQSGNFKPEGNRGPLHPDFISTAKISPENLEILQGDKWAPFGPQPAAPPVPAEPASLKDAVVAAERRYLTGPRGPQFREQTAQGAVELARTEQHLIPNDNGVGFVGGPENVKTMDDLNAVRADFDKHVELGSRVGAQRWYKNARGTISEIAGAPPVREGLNTPPRADLAATELAAWSPQSTPPVNQNFAIAAHNAYEMGQPLDKVRTGQQARAYQTARDTGEQYKFGKKTGPYFGSINPTMPEPPTSANDIWHARALGYTKNGQPWKSALTEQQHVFMDGETALAADRAGKRGLGGDNNWTAQMVQAAGWVGKRAEDIFNKAAKAGKPITMDEALKQANVQYGDSINKQVMYGTHDAIPGQGTGHLPEISEGSPEVRRAFSEDARSQSTRPGEGGSLYDAIYNALGAWQRPSVPMTSNFRKTPTSLPEITRGTSDRPLVATTGPSGARVVDPASRKMVEQAEGIRAYGTVQNMPAATYITGSNKAGRSRDLAFNPGGADLSPEVIDRLEQAGAEYGKPHVMHLSPDTALMTNYGEDTKALTPKQAASLGEQLASATGQPGPVQRVERQSYSEDLSGKWATKAGPSVGSGKMSRWLMKKIGDKETLAKLDGSDELRSVFKDLYDRDVEQAAQGNTVRQDVQKARKIIFSSKDGWAKLAAAVKAGAVGLPALGAIYVGAPRLQQLLGPAPSEEGT